MNRALSSMRALALGTFLVGLASATAPVAVAAGVSIVIDGQPLALNPGPIERAGRVFVPLRGIFERLGAMVVYQAGTINATKGRATVSLQIGSTTALINGQQQYLDVAPFIVGATTYVPLRFIAQSLGANVNYSDSTQVVSIGMGHGPPPYPPVRPPQPPPNPAPMNPLYLVGQRPAPGATVDNRFVTIAAQFSRAAQPDSVRVWLDGNDISNRSNTSAGGFSYTPPAPLAFGAHKVRAAGTARDGSRFDRSWSFTVRGAPPPPASPIKLQEQQPAPQASIKDRFATISAQFSREVDAASVRVWLDGNNISSRSGISRTGFSYKPPAPLDFGSHTVRVAGNGPGGSPFDRSWSFTVTRGAPAPMRLTITNPAADAAVGPNFMLRGNTVANASITVTAGAAPSETGQFNGTTTAGPGGNFSLRVALTVMAGQQAVKVRIRATDPATSQTAESVLQLRLK